NEVACHGRLCACVEIVGTQFVVGVAVVEHMPDDDQDCMTDGNGGLLGAAAGGESMELGSQIGMLGTSSGVRCLDERVASGWTACARLAAAPLACTLGMARTHAGPGRQMRRTGKAAHVGTNLRQ